MTANAQSTNSPTQRDPLGAVAARSTAQLSEIERGRVLFETITGARIDPDEQTWLSGWQWSDIAAFFADEREAAANWRALMSSQRIRMLGCAGLTGQAPIEHAHIGLELWALHPEVGKDDESRAYLRKYVEACKRVVPR